MKLLVALGILLGFGSRVIGQTPSADVTYTRIRVMSADPWFIKSMIEGTPVNQPELSTILGFAGIPEKESTLIQGIFGRQGRIIVDPTDNSLIFIPNKR